MFTMHLGYLLLRSKDKLAVTWAYSNDILDIQGKSLTTADSLWREPVCGQTVDEKDLQEAALN